MKDVIMEKEKMIKKLINYAERVFKDGNTLIQIKNLKALINNFGKEINIDLSDADYLIENSKKLNVMISAILSMRDYSDFLENELFYTLAVTYAEKNNIEIKEFNTIEETDIDLNCFEPKFYAEIDILKEYLKELDDKILSVGEERELFARYKKGDLKARDQIIYYNLRLVISIAKKYTGRGVEFLDLIQEGNNGLMRAVDKFDLDKHFKFSTYATWWIKQAITRAIADTSRTIRIPVHMNEDMGKVDRFIRDYSQRHYGEIPDKFIIAGELDLAPDKVEFIMNLPEIVSLNQPVRNDENNDDSELGSFIEDTKAEDPDKDLYLKEFRDAVFNGSKLSDREKRVIALRFGFADGRVHTLEDVGREFNVTRERVRQIERKALIKLRSSRSIKEFDPREDEGKILTRKVVFG